MSKIKLKDFDLMGIFEIPEQEILRELRPFVTATNRGTFLSRSSLFWKELQCEEAIQLRDFLTEYLEKNKPQGKNAFIVLDYMANISGKIYYKLCEDYVNKKSTQLDLNKAKQCLFEDIRNIISLLESDFYNVNLSEMPNIKGMLPKRNIECNNMALLYIFTKSLIPPRDYNILNTGLGGIFIGPFFKCLHGTDWTNLLKSKYVRTNNQNISSVLDLVVDKKIFSNKKILFLDDNVGTGATMFEIKQEMEKMGYNFMCGAVQYNWLNYYRVSVGEKEIEKFDPSKIDFVTQFNYPGHKLLEHVIEIFEGNRDFKSEQIKQPIDEVEIGRNYIEYKRRKHYYDEDLKSLQEKSCKFAELAGFKIKEQSNGFTSYNKNLNADSINLMKNIENLIKKGYSDSKDDEIML